VKNNFYSLALDWRNGVLIGNLLFFYVKKYVEIGYRSGHKKTGKTEKATKKKNAQTYILKQNRGLGGILISLIA
jgi:hypothetical protein